MANSPHLRLPRSRHRPVTVTEGSPSRNFNKTGVRLWTDRHRSQGHVETDTSALSNDEILLTIGTKLDRNDRSESCPLSHDRALIAVEPLERLADQLGPRQG